MNEKFSDEPELLRRLRLWCKKPSPDHGFATDRTMAQRLIDWIDPRADSRAVKAESECARLRAELAKDIDPDDLPKCIVSYGRAGHDGVGWYYWDAEYEDEGSVGAFETLAEAVLHASNEGSYMIGEIRGNP